MVTGRHQRGDTIHPLASTCILAREKEGIGQPFQRLRGTGVSSAEKQKTRITAKDRDKVTETIFSQEPLPRDSVPTPPSSCGFVDVCLRVSSPHCGLKGFASSNHRELISSPPTLESAEISDIELSAVRASKSNFLPTTWP